ncbi:atypical/ABC1/ABC1-B protein kinase [Amylocystis lapponica]|nr:atypical/ABC1/ABC1-B protein kinase [Amylocystis lapponica]
MFSARLRFLARARLTHRPPPCRPLASSSAPLPASSSRLPKYLRRSLYATSALAALYALDREYNASAIIRNLRTFWACAIIALDYKLNFTPETSDRIPALHQRVADRVFDLLTENGGLYIKIGQAIANNAALLPRPMQEKFARLFDDAPQVPYAVVRRVFEKEFGRPPAGPGGVFEVFDETAAASASIAQVHRAKLRTDDGTDHWVAVKVQKPDVSKQVEWDLGAYRLVMWIYEKYLFDLPVYFTVDFISEHLRRELDFELEAQNAMRTAEFVAAEPRLTDRVYIPKVYPELSTKKVMVAEWIDGVRLSDTAGIRSLMGESSTPSPTPLKGGVRAVMQTMVDLFSAQIFQWGWVHCDPHPGNIIIRPHPAHRRTPQLVLLDHGLYVRVDSTFQHQYASLWKGLLAGDWDTIRGVAEKWGIGSPDLFASATLLRPMPMTRADSTGSNMDAMNQYDRSVAMKEKLRSFLTDTDKMPKVLIFIGRNMRIVPGNNQTFGSPVNRIRITGNWAAHSLTAQPGLTLLEILRARYHHVVFLAALVTIDVAFWVSRVRRWVRLHLGLKGEGFEDELERTMRGFAKSNFGVEIAEGAFNGLDGKFGGEPWYGKSTSWNPPGSLCHPLAGASYIGEQ